MIVTILVLLLFLFTCTEGYIYHCKIDRKSKLEHRYIIKVPGGAIFFFVKSKLSKNGFGKPKK